jgi:Uma2 family endonuclease
MPAMPRSNRDMTPSEPAPIRWTKEEYMACVAQGGFEGLKVYLFRGELLKMAPIGAEHSGSTGENNSLFVQLFAPKGYVIRVQCPLDVPGQSMPEPDFAIVTKDQNRRRPAPNHAVLIVEMSFSTQKHDREEAQEYAGAGVDEYWIVDLDNRRMEVYRGIIDDPTALHGKRYADIKVLADSDSIAPLAAPEAMIRVGDLIVTPLP